MAGRALRHLLVGARSASGKWLRISAAIALGGLSAAFPAAPAYALDSAALRAAVQEQEQALHARIGMAVVDAAGGLSWQYRGDERFPLNSTGKVFACAALLAKVDAGALAREQALSIRPELRAVYSPITEKLTAPASMTLGEICRAAVSYSDNTAANVIVEAIGGPAGFTAYLRLIGDRTTRLDRLEPELNEATPGDLRDTTTPLAIVASLHRILLGDALSPASRAELRQWMADDQVAGALLRAGLPSDWTIADKSGAGGNGSRSIVAVIWPPARQPLVVAVYVTQTAASTAASDRAIARIGKVLSGALDR